METVKITKTNQKKIGKKNQHKHNNPTTREVVVKKFIPAHQKHVEEMRQHAKNRPKQKKYVKQVKGKQFSRISKALTLPGSTSPIRWASQFSAVPTAVASIAMPMPVPANVANENPAGLPAGMSAVFVSRIAECALKVYTVTAGQSATYQFFGARQVDAANLIAPSSSWTVHSGSWTGGTVEFPLGNVYASATTTFQPHGSIWFGAADTNIGDDRYFWFDIGSTITYNVSVTTVGGSVTRAFFVLDMWTNSGHTDDYYFNPHTVTTNPQLLTGTVTIDRSGYYRIRTIMEGTEGLLTIENTDTYWEVGTAESLWGHRAVNQYSSNVSAIQSYRMMAVSALYTNTSAKFDKQGLIAGLQLPLRDHWTEYVSNNMFNSILLKKGVVKLPAETGMYGYIKPADITDFEFQNYTFAKDGVLYDSFWPLRAKTSEIVIASNIAQFDARGAEYTFDFHIEYQTEDMFRSTKLPPHDEGSFSKALDHVRDLPQFCENPLHLKKIWGAIKGVANDVASGVEKYGPLIAKGAQFISSL